MTSNERFVFLRNHLGKTQKEFAILLSEPISKIVNIENNIVKISIDILNKLLDTLYVNPAWIVQGRGDIFIDGRNNPANYNTREDVVGIKYLSNFLKLSEMDFSDINTWHEALCIPACYIKGYDAHNVRAIMFFGDTMEPTIADGALVLCDATDQNLVDGKVYIVKVENEILLRRLFKTKSKIIVKSDNTTFIQKEYDISEVQIITKVFTCIRCDKL